MNGWLHKYFKRKKVKPHQICAPCHHLDFFSLWLSLCPPFWLSPKTALSESHLQAVLHKKPDSGHQKKHWETPAHVAHFCELWKCLCKCKCKHLQKTQAPPVRFGRRHGFAPAMGPLKMLAHKKMKWCIPWSYPKLTNYAFFFNSCWSEPLGKADSQWVTTKPQLAVAVVADSKSHTWENNSEKTPKFASCSVNHDRCWKIYLWHMLLLSIPDARWLGAPPCSSLSETSPSLLSPERRKKQVGCL